MLYAQNDEVSDPGVNLKKWTEKTKNATVLNMTPFLFLIVSFCPVGLVIHAVL